MPVITKSIQYGAHTLTIETGRIAKQATASVVVSLGETIVLATVVAQKTVKPGQDFLPLTVHYQERSYAAGKIPGGYFKREGRPTERETLISRLIDRPIRPLFPEGFNHEIQVIVTLLSLDEKISSDIPAMIGASAALAISGVPFIAPIAASRVGYRDGIFLLNPSWDELEQSQLDLVVAGTEHGVLMVESEARELPEDVMLDAVLFGHHEMQKVIHLIKDLARDNNAQPMTWIPATSPQVFMQEIEQTFNADIRAAYQIREKQLRQNALDQILVKAKDHYASSLLGDKTHTEQEISGLIENLKSKVVRSQILDGQLRIDGRDTQTVRPIEIQTHVLPRVHGSALFTRGETQALVVVTMGTEREAQIIDALEGEYKDVFMLHYNFPPYCVGEVGMLSGPKRREIGHGNLAKRGVAPTLPTLEQFPYSIRVVSEITESNGSSSMATVCGTSLALMDAGVPIKAPVAGIAMGLIKEGERFAVLTDILGDEDHLGDMDFKVAGTAQGITALQMDIKIENITPEIMRVALEQAKQGRLHILGIMNQAIATPRTELSKHAPRITIINIPVEKIRDVIGKGGSVIKSIIEETGAMIDISDDGEVKVAAVGNKAMDAAIERIRALTVEVEIGAIYEGRVARIADFGAFVNILPGKDGLVHISQIADQRIDKVTDVLSEGQIVKVKVLDIDRQGRIRLSMRALLEQQENA